MISHEYRYIFVWIMKTGGTSLNMALRNRGLGRYGVAHKRSKEQKVLLNPVKHKPAHFLRTLEEFAPYWDDYFKFAFVRNPWDLLVSWYHYDPLGHPDFATYIRHRGWFEPKHQFAGCLDRITDEGGNILVDFVGRFENFQEDFQIVCRRIGIRARLPHENRTEHEHYRRHYTEETAQIVATEFARDIQAFGYSF